MKQKELSPALQVSTEGMPVLASGVHGTVFLMDEDRILKLYNPDISREQTESEYLKSLEAFRLGIPTAEPFGTVQDGDRNGIIFERVRGDTLGHMIAKEPERLGEYAEKYAALARKLYGTHTQKEFFPELKTELKKALPRLSEFCSGEDLSLLEELTDCIPEDDCLLHGDLHAGNIMVRDGELLLIDLPEMTRGWKDWDLAAVYRDMIIGPMFPTELLEKSIGMGAELIAETGRAFFRAYTGLEGEALDRYLEPLLPLYGMNTIFTLCAAEDRDRETCRSLIPMLMKEAIRKHEQVLRGALAKENKGE